MTFLSDYLSTLGPGYHVGTTDLIAIVRDLPRETAIDSTAAMIRAQDVIAAESFELLVAQKAATDTRYFGEGAESQTLSVQGVTITGLIKMPVMAPVPGWVDPAFASLWDLCRLAYWGTASAAIGNLLRVSGDRADDSCTYRPANIDAGAGVIAVGQTTLYTDNIADFAALPMPFTAYIPEFFGVEGEAVIVTDVDKRKRALTLAAPTTQDHATIQQIVARPTSVGTAYGPEREPDWSLYSLREGMLAPALVNKITLEAESGKPLVATIEVLSLGLYRDRQPETVDRRQALLSALAIKPPARLIPGYEVSLSPASAHSGAFGLSSALGDPLFGGFQGLQLPNTTVTGLTVIIDNHLIPIYTQQSMSADKAMRQRQNSFPFALASEGRTISGQIKYRSSIEPWAVAERLAGPSALAGGGLIADYGAFKITLPELAWTPASELQEEAEGDEPQSRRLDWTMMAETYDAMPLLEYSNLT